VAQIPAQTAYLNFAGKYPVRRDWVVVEAVTCEPVSLLLGDYQRCFREKQRRGSPEMPEMPVPQAFLALDAKPRTARNSEGHSRTTPNKGCE
jgi:hypothetical protein